MLVNISMFVVTTILGAVIGFLLHKIQTLYKKQKAKDEADLILLKSNLTNTFYAYEQTKEIPDYVLQNWLDEYDVYTSLGGNSYMSILKEKIVHFKIIRTGVLQ